MIRFIRDFALGLDIRQNGTRIGLVLFSEMVEQGIELDEHEDIHGLVSHLYKMQMSKGHARMDEVLRYVRTKSFRRSVSRKGAAQVVVMLTASSSLKIHRTKKQAVRARKSGITFITIGVGGKVQEEELRVIAGVASKGDVAKVSARVNLLPTLPPLSELDDEAAMMMQDLMMGDDPLAANQVIPPGAGHDEVMKQMMMDNSFPPKVKAPEMKKMKKDEINVLENDSIPMDNLDARDESENRSKVIGQEGNASISLIGGEEEEEAPSDLIGGNKVTNEADDIWNDLNDDEDDNEIPTVPVEDDMMKDLMGEKEEEEMATVEVGVSEAGTSESGSTSTTTVKPPSPVFMLQDFTELESILMDTVLQTCAAEPTDNPVSDQPCGTRQEADLMFVVDSANAGKKNTRKAMDLIRSVAGDMEIDRDKVQLGLVAPDPCAPQESHQSFNLSQGQNKEHLINSLGSAGSSDGRGSTSDFANLVRDLRRTAFRYRNGARKNAKRVAILIVDGQLDDPLNTLTEARRIRDRKGVEIYVISVGTETPQPEMMMMCDYPTQKHFYHVDNYDRLEDMRETLVDVLCDDL
ncbi:collagen alpha-6(VI) chain-like [Babylonia areolata]|uniref:collagen alpha-6(VI) chain-like n=1 Tax=Babylonia areolata TaxID=304850 RepID=UPI003FD45F78